MSLMSFQSNIPRISTLLQNTILIPFGFLANLEYFSEFFGTIVYILPLYHLCNLRNEEFDVSLCVFD